MTEKKNKSRRRITVILLFTLFAVTSCSGGSQVKREDEATVLQTYTKEQLIEYFPSYKPIFDDVDVTSLYREVFMLCGDVEWITEGEYSIGGTMPAGDYVILVDPASDEMPSYRNQRGPYLSFDGVVNTRTFESGDGVMLPSGSRMARIADMPDFSLSGRDAYYSGSYKVGRDIEPGDYFYILNYRRDWFPQAWVRGSDAGDTGPNINFGYLYVSENAAYVHCSDYILIPKADKPQIEINVGSVLPAGMYEIGVDIPAGTYQIAPIYKPSGYRDGPADWKDFKETSYTISDGASNSYLTNDINGEKKYINASDKVILETGFICLVNCTLTLQG